MAAAIIGASWPIIAAFALASLYRDSIRFIAAFKAIRAAIREGV